MRIRSIHSHRKPHSYTLKKIRVNMWKRRDDVTVEYGTIYHMFYLMMWFFKFVTGISSREYFIMWWIFALVLWISICDK